MQTIAKIDEQDGESASSFNAIINKEYKRPLF